MKKKKENLMKKKLMALMATVLSVFVFCGCGIVIDVGAEINSDESGTFTASVLLDEELYETLMGMSDSSEDDADEMQPIEYRGESYYGVRESENFEDLDELKELLTTSVDSDTASELGTMNGAVFKEVEISKNGLKGTLNKDFFSLTDEETAEYITLDAYITFTFPGKIKNTNGTIEENGKTVYWKIGSDTPEEIYVETSGSFPVLLIVLGAAVLIAVVLVLVLKKKKTPAAEELSGSTVPDMEAAAAGAETVDLQPGPAAELPEIPPLPEVSPLPDIPGIRTDAPASAADLQSADFADPAAMPELPPAWAGTPEESPQAPVVPEELPPVPAAYGTITETAEPGEAAVPVEFSAAAAGTIAGTAEPGEADSPEESSPAAAAAPEPQPAPMQPEARTYSFCPGCGNRLSASGNFCPNCGRKLN